MSLSENIPGIGVLNKTSLILSQENTTWTTYKIYIKRIFDIFFSLLILPVLLPILLILMFLIKVSSKGPSIYKSWRIGKDGRKFKIYKLRTMCVDANKKLEELLVANPLLKQEWLENQKLKHDPRVTSIGRFLRATSLDEIPQIFNVLKGDMSFVGPRPIIQDEIKRYGAKFSYYKSLRPGITGLWQINGRNNCSYESRVKLDARYAKEHSFNMDLGIILRTIPVALSKKGAY